jgi:hypothetical protein
MISKVSDMAKNDLLNKFSNLKQGQLYLKGKIDEVLSDGNAILYIS